MRIILFFLIGLCVALPLMAQELSEEMSELSLDVETAPRSVLTVTNATGEAGSSDTSALREEFSSLILIQDPSEGIPELVSGSGEAFPSASNATHAAEQEDAQIENRLRDDRLIFLTETAGQYADEGEHEEAERTYLRALEADPDNQKIRFQLSSLYILMDRYPDAVRLLNILVIEYPDNLHFHNNLAWCYAVGIGVKNKERALWHAREGLLLNSGVPSLWNTLAEAYYMAGDYKKALRSAEYAIDLLHRTGDPTSRMQEFEQQRLKILRAERVLKRLEGLDDEES